MYKDRQNKEKGSSRESVQCAHADLAAKYNMAKKKCDGEQIDEADAQADSATFIKQNISKTYA